VGFYHYLPIDHPESLLDVEVEAPQPAGRDLLVEVQAVSVNPVDTKRRAAGTRPDTELKILGWDAAGIVSAVGPQAKLFKPGDKVYYAGSNQRPGANSQLHLVDERIVGPKPTNLSFAEAAAMPLTTITAWEAMFERMGISKSGADTGKLLLILGGAGGVGSIAIQLAKKLARLKVIASASRPDSIAWVKALGADATVDHLKPLPEQMAALGAPDMDYIFCCNNTEQVFPVLPRLVAPQGRGRPLGDHPPLLHDVGVVGHLERGLGELLHEQHRHPLRLEPADGAEDLLHDDRGQPHGRLVEQHDLGARHEGPADGQHLLLAAGERAGELGAPLLELGEELVDPPEVAGGLGAEAEEARQVAVGPQEQVVLGGERREDVAPLRRVGQAEPGDARGGEPLHRLAVEQDPPAARDDEARDGPHGGGLAGPVGADERHHLAGLHPQRGADQHLGEAVSRVEILDDEHARSPSLRPAPRPAVRRVAARPERRPRRRPGRPR